MKKIIHFYFTITLIFQEYSVQITFREDWDDIRLAYDDYNGTSCFEIMTRVKIISSQEYSFVYLYI